MAKWSLSTLLENLHDDIHQQLKISRTSFEHPGTKGDASEKVWLELFRNYLPKRYQTETAHVVDIHGNFSEQIDIVVFDRQYSPFIFKYKGKVIIPAESVYAVFESKQSINANYIKYAKRKIQSVRQLHRTSLPIPYAGGTYSPKPPIHIYGGILSFESDWNPALGTQLRKSLSKDNGILDIGCIAAHGYFNYEQELQSYTFYDGGKPATAFLFKLISQLQFSGTVPMIDVLAYSQWLNK